MAVERPHTPRGTRAMRAAASVPVLTMTDFGTLRRTQSITKIWMAPRADVRDGFRDGATMRGFWQESGYLAGNRTLASLLRRRELTGDIVPAATAALRASC